MAQKILLPIALAIFCPFVFAQKNINSLNVDGVMLYYTAISDTEVALVNKASKKYSGTVIIPNIIMHEGKSYRVTKIGKRAFFESTSLREVRMSKFIVEIEAYAFYGCSSLETIRFSNSLQSIGHRSFGKCSSLVKVTLPKTVRFVAPDAFENKAPGY